MRYYPKTSAEAGLYFEGRAAAGTLREEFTFVREALPGTAHDPHVSGENINYSNKRTAGSAGMAIGTLRAYETGFYYDIRLGYDRYFYDIEGDDFQYEIITGRASSGNGDVRTTFVSRIRDNTGSWFTQLSLGYFF